MTILGDNNVAMVSQDGIGSTADIYQEGDLNLVQGLGGVGTYAINDNGSTLDASQIGNSNTINVEQTAFGASATISQNGVGNVATVEQR
jgi:hypothetical protein